MAEDILRRIRAQREKLVDLPGIKAKIKVRRPPLLWLANWRREGSDDIQLLMEVVIGWSGVTEADLFKDGASDVEIEEFNLMAAVEWICDKPEYAVAISKAIQDNLIDRAAAEEKHEGNS